ncbi:AraC family transcriptional regulator [Polyangium spumosum]|uniref:Helix-turn-helix domain-containing protein n=1 Tax=Polyangium spumosum TaxID=889282 RepID=A0A6N7PF89_9BACT|nr:AraC family transcriptional regulator [Polyangium spumosum]MRG90678.1 helix-turn-helix domain-containing protein [Polyangium spumosum]
MRQPADRSRQDAPWVQGPAAVTCPATLLSPFLRHAARTGWSEQELTALCARHGVRRPAIDDLTARVPKEGAHRIVEEICARSEDDNLGLHLAREAEPSWMALPGLLGMSVTHVREALAVGTDYNRRLLAGPASLWQFIDEQGQLHLTRTHSPRDPPASRHFVEAGVGACIVLLRRFTGLAIKAVQVSFPHDAPADTSAHVELLGTRDLRFGVPLVEIVFPASVLDLRNQGADAGLLAFLRRQAEAVIEARGGPDLTAVVWQGLQEALWRGEEASLDRVAQSLGMTGRTLQRRLAEDGVRFSALLSHVRCEWALELLQRPGVDIDDIAERIGLSDARSLRRALKRHTGRTPSELRRS